MAYGSCDLEQVLVTPGLRFVIGRVSRSALHQNYHQGGKKKQAEVSCQEARMVSERNRGNSATALPKSILLWRRREAE